MSSIELLSVHVPKCAGTALLHAFERRYEGQVFRDYEQSLDDPAADVNLDPCGYYRRYNSRFLHECLDAKIVHGHFNPRKYRAAKPKWVITFLRDPVERLVSHYGHWLDMPSRGHRLHDYMLREKLSIEDFARLTPIRYLLTRFFFAEVSVHELSLFCFYDDMESSVESIKKLTGLDFDVIEENKNEASSYLRMRDDILSDAILSRKLRDLIIEDVRFYEQARQRSAAGR